MPNQTIYASLFYTELKWLNDVKEYLRTCQIDSTLSIQQKQRLFRKARPFTFKNGELYRMGQDNILRKCLTTTKT